jgi:hypothetical protein
LVVGTYRPEVQVPVDPADVCIDPDLVDKEDLQTEIERLGGDTLHRHWRRETCSPEPASPDGGDVTLHRCRLSGAAQCSSQASSSGKTFVEEEVVAREPTPARHIDS